MLSRIPGFRSGTRWKQVCACTFYGLWLLFVLGFGVDVAHSTFSRAHAGAPDVAVVASDQAPPRVPDPIGSQQAAAKPPADAAGAGQPAPPSADNMDEDAPAGVNLPAPGAVAANPDGIPCRSGDVLAGVYHPGRLTVVTACTAVTGQVTTIRHEKDGDYHINLLLDAAYADLVNEVNRAHQHGDLVVEVIPADSASVPIPHVGDHIQVVGAYVLDKQHGGWAEIHPAWRITPADGKSPAAGTSAPSAVAPAPPVLKPTPTPSESTGQATAPAYP